MTKTNKIVYYILLVIISALFLFSGFSKVAADPNTLFGQSVMSGFATAHLPLWFMYFIGVAEILGGIGLWIPKLMKWAARGLSIILVGAVVVTIYSVSIVMALFPAVVLALMWYVSKLAWKNMPAAPIAPVAQ